MVLLSTFRHASIDSKIKCTFTIFHNLYTKIKTCPQMYMKMILSRNNGSLTNSASYHVRDILEQWTKEFRSYNIPEPDSSAEIILAHVLGHKTLYSVDKEYTKLTSSQVNEMYRLCQLRLERMPVQYVIGEWDFHDLTLKMRPPVLIPRPETEELAELCINSLTQSEGVPAWNFLEIGAGTGAVSIFLLMMLKKMKGVALDISPNACQLTSENAEMARVNQRLHVINGDFNDKSVLQELSEKGPYQLIVSNPPYITTKEMKNLQPEILWYEDHKALDGGVDGMSLIQAIILRSADLNLLQEGGHIWLEVASEHPTSIQKLLTVRNCNEKLTWVETVKDAFGKNRFCHLQYGR